MDRDLGELTEREEEQVRWLVKLHDYAIPLAVVAGLSVGLWLLVRRR